MQNTELGNNKRLYDDSCHVIDEAYLTGDLYQGRRGMGCGRGYVRTCCSSYNDKLLQRQVYFQSCGKQRLINKGPRWFSTAVQRNLRVPSAPARGNAGGQ